MRNKKNWQKDARAKCDDDKNLQFSSRKKYSAACLMEKAFENEFQSMKIFIWNKKVEIFVFLANIRSTFQISTLRVTFDTFKY